MRASFPAAWILTAVLAAVAAAADQRPPARETGGAQAADIVRALPGQEPAGAGPSLSGERLADTLRNLQDAISSKQRQIETTRAELKAAADDTTAKAAEARLEAQHREAADLARRFTRLVAGADESLFTEEPRAEFDPKEKLLGLLKPILLELEQLTANSREISSLQTSLGEQIRRRDETTRALTNLRHVLEEDLEGDVRSTVEGHLDIWSRRRAEAETQIAGIEYELADRRRAQKPFLDSVGTIARSFLRTRGFHLFLGALSFAAVFLLFGAIRTGLGRMRAAKTERHFANRLIDLLYRAMTVAIAIGSTLFVFNVTGDWFLLGIALAFLIGLGWVTIKAIPQFSQQITLVLNMGAVREGECVTFEGMPWRVTSLGFTVVLANDRLEGGEQRLPVRMIVGMHSRPLAPREELFPSRVGDWVRLADGTTGMVDYQTPAVVRLLLLGGASKAYPTAAFLEQNPENLSEGFRVQFSFGIDYRHQPDSTSKIPAAMQERVTADLIRMLETGQLRAVRVEFQTAAASSLDYAVKIDVAGSAAARYSEIERAAVRSLVEACNDNGWVIPFQQLTVHRAAG